MGQLWFAVKSARPTQWIKNIVVFAPIVFSGFLVVPGSLAKVIWVFILFCGLSSGVYILNDLIDIKNDRKHPFKKKRPIASGKLNPIVAISLFAGLITTSLSLAYLTSNFVFITMLTYLIINIVYSLWLKKIAIIDVFMIAIGFVLRVYTGAFVINVHMDVWFLLTVVSASLFLAVGKRRSEMTLLANETLNRQSRQTLSIYTPTLLDAYTTMFANTTWLSYALFSFLHPSFSINEDRVLKWLAILPRTLVVDKWLMATVPLVIYGVMRYMQLIYEKNEGESPHKVLMSDMALLTTVGMWGVMVLVILYVL